jgi:hypothetical protein
MLNKYTSNKSKQKPIAPANKSISKNFEKLHLERKLDGNLHRDHRVEEIKIAQQTVRGIDERCGRVVLKEMVSNPSKRVSIVFKSC